MIASQRTLVSVAARSGGKLETRHHHLHHPHTLTQLFYVSVCVCVVEYISHFQLLIIFA